MYARTVASLATAVSLAVLASVAQANTVTGTIGSANFSVTCPNGCTLIPSDGSFLNPALESAIPAPTPANEVAYLNNLLNPNGTFTAAQVTTTTTDGDSSEAMNIFGPYFWLKIDGPNAGYVYFQNSDGAQTVQYTGTGDASGLSHYAQVPLPAAALLFLTGLGGLVGWRRWSGQGEAQAPQMA